MCDSWPVSGSSTPSARSGAHGRARRGAGRAATARASTPARTGAGVARPWSARNAGRHEQLARDERRDRVAGQAEDERARPHAEGRAASPGLHRDAPEHLLDAEVGLRSRRTRSCGPTETPPEVTSTSASSPRRSRRGAPPRSSSTGASASTVAPAAPSAAASMSAVRLVDLAGPSGSPGGRSSVPVVSTATRGRRAHATSPTPAAASAPSCAAPSRVPASSDDLARAPCRRRGTHVGARLSGRRHLDGVVHDDTCSIGTTASAPSGTTPPVAIPIASPGASGRFGRPARGDARDDRQPARACPRPHGEAVHRRARERRQVDRRRAPHGEHPAGRRVERAPARPASGAHARQHGAERLLDDEQPRPRTRPRYAYARAVISVVVPVYNEERSVALLYDELAVGARRRWARRGRSSSSTTARATARSPR